MKILLVEDDRALAELLHHELSDRHYLVDFAADGQSGWQLAEGLAYDLILLDIGLPKLNGIEFCQQRRERGDRTPILLMTSQESSQQKVTGLDAGADDYLIKPFQLDELLARIRALLRRGDDTRLPVLAWDKLRLDPNQCQVTYDRSPLKLTAKEYELLELFLRHPQQIFSKSALLDRLWLFEDPPSDNAVRTHIKSLRQKLKKAGDDGNTIETIYGLGYRLNPALESSSSSTQHPAEVSPEFLPIWRRYQPHYCDRLQTIQTVLCDLEKSPQWRDRLKLAIREAHTLAGSLGSFGLNQLSQTAGTIETALQNASAPDGLAIALSPHMKELYRGLCQTTQSTLQVMPNATRPSLPESPQLLIVEADIPFNQSLSAEAERARFNPHLVTTLEEAKTMFFSQRSLGKELPDLVLLDLALPQTSKTEILRWISQLAEYPIPVVVLADDDTLENRVAVVRAGGQGFLYKPISPQKAIASLEPWIKPEGCTSPHLLIVDDDRQLLDYLQQILAPWGLHSTLLGDPQQFWAYLKKVQPNLILLDIEMPEVSGIELCQVLRNDPQWMSLPVLFLSSHGDPETIERVFWAGGDDYIQKPIVEPQLIARIFNRLERLFATRRRSIKKG
ncbi:response regulator [Roseofilum casamattae]|uniref:Response regulator n=1 Tax=Roseofilum casamattae BLCC-M143 TaxID=3022442 RepID=A0ABT7C3D0_9CYAN|nr:response regulator [Roseofilum casamattae]MDJ1185587.1 response regulator [Roseofilum casamattae BLCC-M143]